MSETPPQEAVDVARATIHDAGEEPPSEEATRAALLAVSELGDPDPREFWRRHIEKNP